MATVRERVRELQAGLVEAKRKLTAAQEKAEAKHAEALAKLDATYQRARRKFQGEIEALGSRSPDDVLPEPPKRAAAKKQED